MKISKEQLLTVGSLDLSGVLDKMDTGQFEEYCTALNNFIDSFPAKEAALMASFNEKNRDSFSKILLEIMDTLEVIHAPTHAQSSFKLLSVVRAGDYSSAASILTMFLSSISALSIDIQIASHKDTAAPEVFAGIAHTESQKSILAVDDMSILLATLKNALQNTTYKFTGVTSGKAALKFLESHTPDLFIFDIEMPEMDGYELAKRVKASGFKAPIIFLTGNATTDYVMNALRVGGADFIVKPVNKEQVLEKICKYIG